MRLYGYLGFLVIVSAEFLLYYQNPLVSTWFTPIVWWGYIVFLDAVNKRFARHSLILDQTREFLLMPPLSVCLWLIFEYYNLFLKNWHYVGLPENPLLRWAGCGVAFSTIIPAIFETSAFLETTGIFAFQGQGRQKKFSNTFLSLLLLMGLGCLLYPLFFPSPFLFGLVWLGFIFLLEPINYQWGRPSILAHYESGNYNKILSLIAAGYLCGILWEFWNYWALGKWIYTVPFTEHIRIFEMPLAGFFGFGPFALELYIMYHFCLGLFGPSMNMRGEQIDRIWI